MMIVILVAAESMAGTSSNMHYTSNSLRYPLLTYAMHKQQYALCVQSMLIDTLVA
jgi:hypothetical protein